MVSIGHQEKGSLAGGGGDMQRHHTKKRLRRRLLLHNHKYCFSFAGLNRIHVWNSRKFELTAVSFILKVPRIHLDLW